MRQLPSLVLLTAACFAPLGLAAAAVLNPAEFTCTNAADASAGGSIAWANGITVETPTIGYELEEGVSTTTALDCSGGQLSEALQRKSKKGAREFLKITMKEVLVSSRAEPDTGSGSPVFWTLDLDEVLVGDTGYFDAYFNVVTSYVSLSFDTVTPLVERSSNLLIFRLRSSGPLEELESATIDYDVAARTLAFRTPLQLSDSRLDLIAAPVTEPGSLALLAVGFTGVVVARRKRRR
jgi:hypothetical protein